MQICGFLNMHIPHTEFVDKLRHKISCGREGGGGGWWHEVVRAMRCASLRRQGSGHAQYFQRL